MSNPTAKQIKLLRAYWCLRDNCTIDGAPVSDSHMRDLLLLIMENIISGLGLPESKT